MAEETNNEDEENIMKILVATDIHLGYNESHPIRGNDSFIAFEEILKHGKRNSVDFILLGGDLFHETRPSTTCLHRCISLLRKYCLGDREVLIEFLSDQSLNFKHLQRPMVNYEDPNLNIAIPVFSIHGNHDDPTGAARLSAMDLLADIGLVNYFGKWTDLTQVEINPLLLKKGKTKLALYGLSHIRDERLSRLFASGEVKMPRAEGEVFNMFVLHQNRAERGPKNFIPEHVIPSFIDLVIWGHEHDCHIEPTESKNGAHISQPGSSVATSLSEGESLTKHCGLLHIKEQQYKMEKIKLKTVRPFVFRHFFDTDLSSPESIKDKITDIVEEMITEAETLINEDEPKQPRLPLLRLVFNYMDDKQQFNAIRFGQEFTERVANPEDMLLLKCQKARAPRTAKGEEIDVDTAYIVTEGTFTEQAERLLETYMETQGTKPLSILSIKAMCEATSRFLDKNDEGSFEDVMMFQCQKTAAKLKEMEFDENNLDVIIENLRVERSKENEAREVARMLNDPNRVVRTYDIDEDDEPAIEDDSDSDDSTSLSSFASSSRLDPSTAGRSRPARGRGSRGPRRTRARGRAT